MKFLAWFIILLVWSTSALGGLIGGLDPQNVEAVNILPNGGFENGESSWTESGSSTFTTTTAAPNLAVGVRTGAWEPNAPSDSLTSTQIDVNAGHANQTCVAKFVYKGAGSFISAQIIDGSSNVLGEVDLENVADFTPKQFIFSGPSSGTIAFRLFSVADSILTYIDDIFVGCVDENIAVNPIVFEQSDTVTGFGGSTGTITHSLNIPVEQQDWSAVVTTGSASLQLDPSVFITDKTATAIDYDFSGLTGTDTVTVRLANTGFTANIVPTVTYNSGELTAAPTFPLAHGLPGRPKHVVVLTEGQSVAAMWDSRYDLCSADDTEIDCDLSVLTIGASNRVQIIASMTPAGTAVKDATATEAGLVGTGNQVFGGAKTIQTADPRSLTLERTDNTSNSTIEHKTTGSSVFSGHAGANEYAIGSTSNLVNTSNQFASFTSSQIAFRTDTDVVGDMNVSGFINVSNSNKVIASGVITADATFIILDTEGAASTDDLDTINGGTLGDILFIKSAASARDPTLKHNTGNLRLSGGTDFTLSNDNDAILLLYNGVNWMEVSRSNNN